MAGLFSLMAQWQCETAASAGDRTRQTARHGIWESHGSANEQHAFLWESLLNWDSSPISGVQLVVLEKNAESSSSLFFYPHAGSAISNLFLGDIC